MGFIRKVCAGFFALAAAAARSAEGQTMGMDLQQICSLPAALKEDFGGYRSPLVFEDGRPVKSAADWAERRKEILQTWHRMMGPWPELLREPKLEYLGRTNRENFVQHHIRVETSS